MKTFQFDSKGVQTDPNIRNNHSKLLKTLQTYINVVCRYRLQLFNQYTQSDDCYKHQDLFNVRKEILNRFQWVINELEQAIENFQIHRLSATDIQHIIDRPIFKEVIETSLNADLSSANNQKQHVPNIDEWRVYRRDLQETKEDLCMLDILLHRGISKVDRLVTVTNLYI